MIRRRWILIAMLPLGCGPDRASSTAGDSTLLSDLAMAAGADSLPALGDTSRVEGRGSRVERGRGAERRGSSPRPAPRSDPVAVQPAPAEEVPAPVETLRHGLRAGTAVSLALDKAVCGSGTRPGDKYLATVTQPVMGVGGFVIPAGSRVVIEVAEVAGGSTPESARITFRVRTIAVGELSWPAKGDVVPNEAPRRVARETRGGDKSKVIGGAIAGAVLGQVLGKDTRSTVIGAAAGAAAGTAAAKASTKYDACIPASAAMTLTLGEDIRV